MPEDVARIGSLGSRTGNVFAGLLEFFGRTTSAPLLAPPSHVEGLHMHDPCAMAYAIDPSLFRMENLHVGVDRTDGPSRGQTLVDHNHSTGRVPNALVGFDVNRERLVDLLITSLTKFA